MFRNKEILLLLIFAFFFIYSFVLYCIPREPLFTISNIALIIICLFLVIYVVKNRKFILNAGVIGLIVYLFLILIINLTQRQYSLSQYVPPIIMIFLYEMVSSLNSERKNIVLRILYLDLFVLLVWSYIRYLPSWLEVRSINVFDSYFGNLDGYSNKILLLFAMSLFYLRKKCYFSSITSVLSFLFILMTERRVAFLFALVCAIGLLYSIFHKKHPAVFYSTA